MSWFDSTCLHYISILEQLKKCSLSFKVKHEPFKFGKTGQYCQGAPLIFKLLKVFICNTQDSQSVKIESLLSTIVQLVRTPFFQNGKTSSNLVSAAPYVNKLNSFKLCIISGLCKTLKSWKSFQSVKIGSSIGEMTEWSKVTSC